MREVKAVLLHLGLSTEGRALDLATRLLENTAEERKAARARSSRRAPADAGGRGGAPASGGVAADVSREGAGRGRAVSGRVADAGGREGAPASGGVATDVQYPAKVLGKGAQEAAELQLTHLPKVLGAADQLKLPKEGAKEVVELLQSACALLRRQFRQLKSHPRRLIDESKQM